jgi:hypothetical protein
MRFLRSLTRHPRPLNSLPYLARLRRPLSLEILEDRALPSTLFVVPAATPADSTHFHDLASAAATASAGDTVQIEPGSAPGSAILTPPLTPLTIQGDPSFGPSTLPQVGSLTLVASHVVLNSLSLGTVNIANGAVGETITNSVVAAIAETAGPLGNGPNVINGNTIRSTVFLVNSGTPAGGDVVTNNAFLVSTVNSATLLSITDANNVLVQNNTFTGYALTALGAVGLLGIGVSDSVNVIIINNDITLTRSGAAAVGFGGISVGTNLVATSVTIAGNRINTNSLGTAITTNEALAGGETIPEFVTAGNNNFVLNKVGVSIVGGVGMVERDISFNDLAAAEVARAAMTFTATPGDQVATLPSNSLLLALTSP